MMTWGDLPTPCPGCGAQVVVGIMSLRATCKCGWWWRDVDPRGWNPPDGDDQKAAHEMMMRERRIRLHAVASYVDAKVYPEIERYNAKLRKYVYEAQIMVDQTDSLLRELRDLMQEAREEKGRAS